MRSSNLKLGGFAAVAVAALAAAFTLVWASGSAARPQAARQAEPVAPRAVAPAAQPAEATAPATTAAPTLQRSFVSAGTGNDANPCTRTAPCRNFAKAITTTLDEGEIVVLDSGGYGPVTIDRPLSIISPSGVYAGITAFTGPAVIVNLTGTGTVKLSGLTLNGLGGDYGVYVERAEQVHLDNLSVNGFSQTGIMITSSVDIDVFIYDTVARRNGVGIWLYAAGAITAEVDRVHLERNGYGFLEHFSAKASIRDSVAARNTTTGFGSFQGSEMNLENSLSTYNQFGIAATGSLATRVSETMIVNNELGLSGTPTSFGNNRLGGNVSNGAWGATIPES